jgi:hypothetical protein
LAKPAKPTLKPDLTQSGYYVQRDSAAKIKRLNNELKNGQLVNRASLSHGPPPYNERLRICLNR